MLFVLRNQSDFQTGHGPCSRPKSNPLAFAPARGETEGSYVHGLKDLHMPSPLTAPEVLAREFLEIRAKILEIAAAFDRLERSEGDVDGDPRIARLREALKVLGDKGEDRAEQVQLVFSRAYDENWQRSMKVLPR